MNNDHAEQMVEILNKLLSLDRKAIGNLLKAKVACNPNMILVGYMREGTCFLNTMSLLNAIVKAMGSNLQFGAALDRNGEVERVTIVGRE